MKWATPLCFGIITFGVLFGFAIAEQPTELDSTARKSTSQTDSDARKKAGPANENQPTFTVRVVDQDGKPVSDAVVGYVAYRIAGRFSDWNFFDPATTGADGETQVKLGSVDRLPPATQWTITAHQVSRRLVGIKALTAMELVSASKSKSIITISLLPECRVHGHVQSTGLEKLNRHLRDFSAKVTLNNPNGIFRFTSSQSEYEFFLPPGAYTLETFGRATDGESTSAVHKAFTVPVGSQDLKLGTLELPPTKLIHLIGKPAPEIADVVAWKNSQPLKIADLCGRYVLLDFWGHRCGPCILEMPKLAALHDKFSKRGLTIIGVHVDGEFESFGAVDTVESLDAKLALARQEIWGGRDLPFPVALIAARRAISPDQQGIRFEGAFESRFQTAEDYGVQFYPHKVLIDQEGDVLGLFNEKEHIRLFDKLPMAE